jgi:hypothetical protein
MSEYKQNLDAEMLDRIIHTAHHHLAVDVVAGCTDHENVTDALIEQELYRYTGV